MLNDHRYGLLIALLLTLTACGSAPPRQPFWGVGLGDAAARFELAKRSEPELIAFLRRMPKGADLHNHLSGAVYSDYLLDSAKENGLNYDLASDRFTSANASAGGKVITLDDLVANSAYLNRFLNTYSMRGWYANTSNGHDHFFDTFLYLSSS